jgi:hypothetical protein
VRELIFSRIPSITEVTPITGGSDPKRLLLYIVKSFKDDIRESSEGKVPPIELDLRLNCVNDVRLPI